MISEELLSLIAQTRTDEVTTLNLSRQGLAALPPEIGQLTKLEILNMGLARFVKT